MAALLVALAIAGVLLVVFQPARSRVSADFVVFYSAGRLVLRGHADRVYDQAWLGAAIIETAPGTGLDPRLPFNEPLAVLAPFGVLALLPVDVALRAWQAVSGLMILAALAVLQVAAPLHRRAVMIGLVAMMAAAPTWSLLIEGQTSALMLLGAGLVVLAVLADRPAAALPGGALLAIKPHYLLPYLVVLLVLRRKAALSASVAGAAAVLLSPLVAGGVPALQAMLGNALSTDQVTPVRLSESWGGFTAALLPAGWQTPVALALLAAAMVALLGLGWRMRREPIAVLGAAGWMGVLASPHALPHDLVLLAVPAWCAVALHRRGRLPSPAWGLVLCNAALLADELHPSVVVAPVVMTAVLLVYAAAFMRRRAAPVLRSTPAAA